MNECQAAYRVGVAPNSSVPVIVGGRESLTRTAMVAGQANERAAGLGRQEPRPAHGAGRGRTARLAKLAGGMRDWRMDQAVAPLFVSCCWAEQGNGAPGPINLL